MVPSFSGRPAGADSTRRRIGRIVTDIRSTFPVRSALKSPSEKLRLGTCRWYWPSFSGGFVQKSRKESFVRPSYILGR